MALRKAFSDALKFARGRKKLSQLDLAQAVDASYVSRLESGQSSATLDVCEQLATALGLNPVSLLALAYAADKDMTPQEVLSRVVSELDALDFLNARIASDDIQHPITAKGTETTRAVLDLKHQGFSQAETAKRLGISTSTVGRHWNRG